jgi:hypothetical protein
MNHLKLSGDRWLGMDCADWDVESPSWPAVESSIRRLDQAEFTIVSLHSDGEAHVAIGGGAGRYIVYETPDNFTFFNLLSEQAGNDWVIVAVGGQEGSYPAIQVVDVETALRAAHAYWQSQQRDSTLVWVEQ